MLCNVDPRSWGLPDGKWPVEGRWLREEGAGLLCITHIMRGERLGASRYPASDGLDKKAAGFCPVWEEGLLLQSWLRERLGWAKDRGSFFV